MAVKSMVSPVIGQFYSRPDPQQPPFLNPGDAISAGSTIGLVEVMKTFTQVQAEEAGRFVRYLVEDEDMVMPGDPLFEYEV
jgi:acetyl-CoA carboxylase biotin carboxyl carrier protein